MEGEPPGGDNNNNDSTHPLSLDGAPLHEQVVCLLFQLFDIFLISLTLPLDWIQNLPFLGWGLRACFSCEIMPKVFAKSL